MKRFLTAVLVFAVGYLAAPAQPASSDGPAFTTGNRLLRPDRYREWIWLSSGLGMSYSDTAESNPEFDNVFVNPAAYREFLKTGRWPDPTVLVLELRAAESKSSINRSGHFQGGVTAVEVHVKDARRFPSGWAFYGFPGDAKSAEVMPRSASCYTCHEQHGTVDTTFVQFYPTLAAVAKQKGTAK